MQLEIVTNREIGQTVMQLEIVTNREIGRPLCSWKLSQTGKW